MCPMLSTSFALLVFQTSVVAQQKKCALLESPHLKDDTVGIPENDYVNLTFWLNVSGCKQSDTIHRMTVKIKSNDGSLEEAGRLKVTHDTCSVTVKGSVHCVSPAGPVQLYTRLNRSHAEIEWKWSWKEDGTYISQNTTVKTNISYQPSVKILTVEAQEVRGHYVINKSQQVVIFCSFDQGNPPVIFRLLDKNGRELENVTRKGSELIHSLAAGNCEQPWPVVRCEAQGSSENRSVTFLVRCPPEFINLTPKQIDPEAADHVTLNIKGHTTEGARCLLTPESFRENSIREVNCSLSGNPPDLLLTLHLEKKDRVIRGNWTLTVSNEIGAGNMDVVFTQDYGATTGSFSTNNMNIVAVYTIISLCCSFLIITVAVFLARTRKKKGGGEKGATDVSSIYRGDAQRRCPNGSNVYALAVDAREGKK